MFKFKTEQKVCDISGVKIGGGNPIALIGTIFYAEEKTRKDFEIARTNLEKAFDFSEQYNLPFIPDVYVEKDDNIHKVFDFISSFDTPFMIDSSEWEARTAALKHCQDTGIGGKAIYNSINVGMGEDERDLIKELKPRNAILLAFNPMDYSVQGKVNLVKSKLIPFAKVAKVENILIDSAVTAIGEGSLTGIKAVIALKSELGLPTGNGIHNLASNWVKRIEEKEVRRICDSSLAAAQALLGADFLMFGPIESAWRIFPVIRMVSDILSDER
jgi:tetrahydromethanopterin S-methyltransferase subunit H